jgi:hypothetical protein
MQKIPVAAALMFVVINLASGQDFRWQQRAEYTMEVKLDVTSHKLTGNQKLTYYNNSRDTLSKVYYHLYFNAFQPGSMMVCVLEILPTLIHGLVAGFRS